MEKIAHTRVHISKSAPTKINWNNTEEEKKKKKKTEVGTQLDHMHTMHSVATRYRAIETNIFLRIYILFSCFYYFVLSSFEIMIKLTSKQNEFEYIYRKLCAMVSAVAVQLVGRTRFVAHEFSTETKMQFLHWLCISRWNYVRFPHERIIKIKWKLPLIQ